MNMFHFDGTQGNKVPHAALPNENGQTKIEAQASTTKKTTKENMNDMNQCLFVGRLVREPVIHTGKNGTCAHFSIAVNRRWTSKTGAPQIETAFVPAKAFNGWCKSLAGQMKGTPVLLTGRLRTESWTKDDETRTQLTLVCESVQVLPGPQRAATTEPVTAPATEDVPF